MTREEKLFKLLKSIVADVDAMNDPIKHAPVPDAEAYYGAFKDVFYTLGSEDVWVCWPNLHILIQEAKQLMKESEVNNENKERD